MVAPVCTGVGPLHNGFMFHSVLSAPVALRRRQWLLAGAALLAATAGLGGCSRQPKGTPVPAGATVLALGDSITFGTGATPETSYPAVLARLTGWNVVNAGVPGHVSAQALERLPELLQEHKPALVLVSIGGNDFLRRLPETDTSSRVRAICEQARASGAQVLLVAVPRPSLVGAVARSLDDHPLYATLAKELQLPLHANGWSDVLSDPALRADPIHANAQGYEKFAQGLADTARAAGLLTGGRQAPSRRAGAARSGLLFFLAARQHGGGGRHGPVGHTGLGRRGVLLGFFRHLVAALLAFGHVASWCGHGMWPMCLWYASARQCRGFPADARHFGLQGLLRGGVQCLRPVR